ncbi:uncharacterized protein LOC141644178 [Silene latifolia]|uniref:uncharacterized protein LOC141644178 n=1 Tax=Silene latifolia TaxID=37657 RepID=UPI003D76BA4C
MALQAGMGLSRLVFIVGAGYTGTILIKNNKLSEIIGEIQNFVKGLETGDSANADADPIAAQVRWLAQEVRQLANGRQITVLNGSSSQTDLSFLILPAATVGALGYGYMWWKGLSFSDLMYVTKHSMAAAVASLKENLQNVTEAIEIAKKHLLQKIQTVNEKIEENKELQKLTLNEVRDLHVDLGDAQNQILFLVGTVAKLEDKMNEVDEKQNLALMGLDYLVQFVNGKSTKAPQFAQEFRSAVKSRCLFESSENLGLQGLLSVTEGNFEDAHQPKNFIRSTSVKIAIV